MGKTYQDQADKRMYETFRDQHGRFWGANVEISTGDPCEVIKAQFTAPVNPDWAKGLLVPPEDVVEMVPRAERARRGYSVFVNYKKWLEKWDARHLDHQKKLSDFARGMGKEASAAEIAKLIANPTEELRRIVGTSPYEKIPRAFIEAASANNKWATGQSSAIPAKAQALLDAIKPVLAAAKSRSGQGLGIDPFEDDGDRFGDDDESAGSGVIDPLGADDDILELEEQYDPGASGNQGGRPVPVAAVGARSGKSKRNKPPKQE